MPKQLIEELLELNREQAAKYNDSGQIDLRERYRGRHPTRIACFKCMDGRVNIAALTQTPFGLIRPFRNIGGIFDLGWTALDYRINDFIDYTVREGARNLFIVTYHFSKSDRHLGCRGHDYDKDRAVESAARLVDQMERVFGKGHEQVYPILVGVETDGEELIFHGADGLAVGMAEHAKLEPRQFREIVEDLYPDMDTEIVRDLLPLVTGNAAHAAKVRQRPKKIEQLEHRERVLAVGAGFDWLHRVNYALIINDLDPTLDDTIAAAAGIIKVNRDAGRLPDDRALYFVSVSYFDQGRRRNNAIERARYLTKLGLEAIRKFHPGLEDCFETLTAVMDWDKRRLEIVEAS